MVAAAFGEAPTMSARAALFKAIGEGPYNEAMKAWSADHSLKPGKAPSGKTDSDLSDDEKVLAARGETNPFSPKFKGTPEEKTARIASLIKTDGGKFAARIAKAAGVTLTGQPIQAVGQR
jgi:hypothetical protein